MSIIPHSDVPAYELQGNTLRGLATPSHGARELEVWQTAMAAGAATPPHVHAGEEVIIELRGQGERRVGETGRPGGALRAPAP